MLLNCSCVGGRATRRDAWLSFVECVGIGTVAMEACGHK